MKMKVFFFALIIFTFLSIKPGNKGTYQEVAVNKLNLIFWIFFLTFSSCSVKNNSAIFVCGKKVQKSNKKGISRKEVGMAYQNDECKISIRHNE